MCVRVCVFFTLTDRASTIGPTQGLPKRRHYTKLSLSSRVPFFYLYLVPVCMFCFCSFLFVVFVFKEKSEIVVFFCSCWSFVDVPPIFFCPADHVVPDCCCFLRINRSGLNQTQEYTWTEKDQRNIYQAPMRAKEKHKHTKKRQRERNRNNKIHMPGKYRRGAFDRESLA